MSQNDKILFALFTFFLVWNESQNDQNIICFIYIPSSVE